MSSRSLGLRTQILLIVLGVAVLPLGLVGVWLTSSAMRSGEQLLRDQLTASADRLASIMQARWDLRRGDIALIAENEATARALADTALRGDDRAYLAQMAEAFAMTVPTIELIDLSGGVRWSSSPGLRASRLRTRPGDAAPVTATGPMLEVRRSITRDRIAVGSIRILVALDALLPGDSSRTLVAGGRAAVRAHGARIPLIELDPSLPFPAAERVRIANDEWFVVLRSVSGPDVDVAVAARAAPYVGTFQSASRVGFALLIAVALIAIGLSIILATRAARALEDLAVASRSVSRGELGATVVVAGPTEVREVGRNFNDMTQQLHRTIDELAKRGALAAVGEFATSLSHEVRNALTSIRVDLDRAALRDLRDPVTRTLVIRASNNVARLEAVVTGALKVARRGAAPLVETDLRQPIRLAAESAGGTFASVPAQLTIDLPSSSVTVVGDPHALQQVFANLLFNAAQALQPGQSATVKGIVTGDHVQVTIIDSGPGMDSDTLGRLAAESYSSKPAGSGLGLPIARRIVAAHGGTLSIDSAVGRGTSVIVTLPLQLNGSFHRMERDGHNGALSARG